jgi:acyl carrier protein
MALEPVLGGRVEPRDDGRPLRDVVELGYDSATALACVLAVEEAFAVQIDVVDDDLTSTFESIASIAALVAGKLTDKLALAAWPAAGGDDRC